MLSKSDFDFETNDFNLGKGKIPTISTIKAQIKTSKELLESGITATQRNEFDRLKMAVNISEYGHYINFDDYGLEYADEPWTQPMFKKRPTTDDIISYGEDEEEEEEYEEDDLYSLSHFEIQERIRELEEVSEKKKANLVGNLVGRRSLFKIRSAKKRIPYERFKEYIGLNNLYIYNDYLIIDITGKFMASKGYLGSLHKDNIKEALQKIIDIDVVSFDINLFLEVAQVFLCDVCVDLHLASSIQCKRAMDGISSFYPLATSSFNIKKYKRNGLMLTPKAKSKKYSLSIYHKGEEIKNCRSLRIKSKYIVAIGKEGKTLAERTLRIEAKLQDFATTRKVLEITKSTDRIIPLMDVLNSTAPVMLEQFKLFCGTSEVLLDRLEWLQEVREDDNNLPFNEILISERIVDLLKENKFDLNILRSHIKTEYPNVKDSEIEKACILANLRRNVLNFLVYHKPKSVTIMLDILRRLYLYYSAESSTGGTNGN